MTSQQLQSTDIQSTTRRPILTHLNADTSWLLSLPRPLTKKHSATQSRSYYHIIIDPWLDGDLVVSYRWLMVLIHSVKGVYSTIQHVRDRIKEIEGACDSLYSDDNGEVDAVFVSTFIEDHCARSSLMQIDPSVPLITVELAAKIVRSWNHFKQIEVMPDLDLACVEDLWQKPLTSLLPDFVRIGRLPDATKASYPYLHWAQIIAFSTDSQPLGANNKPETILYSPHGIREQRLEDLAWATEHSKPLVLMHGLDPAWSPQQANLGVDNGQELCKKLNPRLWIATHDEHLNYEGIIGWFQSKYKKSFPEWLTSQSENNSTDHCKPSGTICKQIENGGSLVLV